MSESKKTSISRTRKRLYEAMPEEQERAVRSVVKARQNQHTSKFGSSPEIKTRQINHDPLSSDSVEKQAEKVIERYVYGAMGRGLLPIPILDLWSVTKHQVDMLRELSGIYELAFDETKSRAVIEYLLEGNNLITLGGSIGGSLLKIVPVFGYFLGAAPVSIMAATSTYGIGRACMKYYHSRSNEVEMSMDELRYIFESEIKRDVKIAEK